MMRPHLIFFIASTLWPSRCFARNTEFRSSATVCLPVQSSTYTAPTVNSGWTSRLIISGLTAPRSIVLDSSGALLVLESGVGIRRLHLIDNGDTCLVVDNSALLVNMTSVRAPSVVASKGFTNLEDRHQLNHGLAISSDGKTLYASSAESVFSWPYSNVTGTVTGNATTVVSGMGGGNQLTRSVLVSQLAPDTIVVSRGSSGSIDQARNVSSGLGQVKAFNMSSLISASKPQDFNTAGRLLGWGLYNAVGLAEHPKTGGIFSMDNGVDRLTRNGLDISPTNPGDEMNYHGTITGTDDEDQGGNYGYPFCNAAWNTSIPDAPAGLVAGQQISVFENSTANDTSCDQDFVRPRLTFEPHQAPLDALFSSDGKTAYVSFHGSTDETKPAGYLVGSVAFDAGTGQPTRAYDSYIALTDIIRNTDYNDCSLSCMRPVGLAILDDRLLFSSDTTGEVYVLVKSSTNTTGHDKILRVAIGVSMALGLVIFILGTFIYWRWKRSRLLLGVHTSGDRDQAGLSLGAVPVAADKDDGIQLANRKSRGRFGSQRNVFQDELQERRSEHSH